MVCGFITLHIKPSQRRNVVTDVERSNKPSSRLHEELEVFNLCWWSILYVGVVTKQPLAEDYSTHQIQLETMRVGREPIRRNMMGPYFCASVANLRQAGMVLGPGKENRDPTTGQPIGPGGSLDHHLTILLSIAASDQIAARAHNAVSAHVRNDVVSGSISKSSSLLLQIPVSFSTSLSMSAGAFSFNSLSGSDCRLNLEKLRSSSKYSYLNTAESSISWAIRVFLAFWSG